MKKKFILALLVGLGLVSCSSWVVAVDGVSDRLSLITVNTKSNGGEKEYRTFDEFKKESDSFEDINGLAFGSVTFPVDFKDSDMPFPNLERLEFVGIDGDKTSISLKPFLSSNKGTLKWIGFHGYSSYCVIKGVAFDGIENASKDLTIDLTWALGVDWKNLSKAMITFKKKHGQFPVVKCSRSMLLQGLTFFLINSETTYKPGLISRITNKIW